MLGHDGRGWGKLEGLSPTHPYLMRFLRWLFKVEDIQLHEISEAWDLLASMRRGVVRGINAAGVRCYEDAEAACVDMRGLSAASGAAYEADDLVCFLCSSMHHEAALTFALSAAATPVSIGLDLGAFPFSFLPTSPCILAKSQPLVWIPRHTTSHAPMPSIVGFSPPRFARLRHWLWCCFSLFSTCFARRRHVHTWHGECGKRSIVF